MTLGIRKNKGRLKEEDQYKKIDDDGLAQLPLTPQQILEVVKSKIRMHSVADNCEMFSSFQLFGRPKNGITPERFKLKLNQWAIYPTKEQFAALW